MEPKAYLKQALKQVPMSGIRLSQMCGWNGSFISQLKTGRKPISARHAVLLQKHSGGIIDARKLEPEFFALLESAGWRYDK